MNVFGISEGIKLNNKQYMLSDCFKFIEHDKNKGSEKFIVKAMNFLDVVESQEISASDFEKIECRYIGTYN